MGSLGQERIVIAMSGGVDSAVAAARLVDQGYDVIGVTLHLWDYPDEGPGSHGRCCAPEDQYDARRTADLLEVPHFTFDRRELFKRTVVDPFVEAYLAGETPSPCAACNRGVKITELMSLADRLGATKLATGHYARVGQTEDGVFHIREGVDRSKDQSYFLYATTQPALARLVFPLGESTKAEVRAEAIARSLPSATKGESQELCFVGSGAYTSFVEERARGKLRPGPIVDADGRVVGNHDGIHRFTIGQRRGLGVAVGKPAFVAEIDRETGTVRLGDDKDLASTEASIEDIIVTPGVDLPIDARVRIRYRHEGALGRVDRGTIRFHAPVRAVSRGQIAVFYDGDRVLGGGRIC